MDTALISITDLVGFVWMLDLGLGRFNLDDPAGTRRAVFADQYLSHCFLKNH